VDYLDQHIVGFHWHQRLHNIVVGQLEQHMFVVDQLEQHMFVVDQLEQHMFVVVDRQK